MTVPYRKKLIEVALPLEAINKESAREKSIRHGHPSTLHLWWARRPLAACRAVLFASLVDDPDSDPAYAHYDAETREHMAGEKRQQLFALIEELVKWENSNDELVINAARAEIARCVASRKIEAGELAKEHKLPGGETVYDLVVKGHGDLNKLRKHMARLPVAESVNAFLAEHAPPVLDPFAGGGSIPLEAQRLGLRAYASDLNPIPVLINKALIEIPSKFANKPPVNPETLRQGKLHQAWSSAQGLAEDVRHYGKWLRDEAERRVGHLYPKFKITPEIVKCRPDLKPYEGEELTVIAWVWARTVASPNPAAGGVHVPLIRSFWLGTKPSKQAWLRPVVNTQKDGFSVTIGGGTPPDDFDPSQGTVNRGGGRCLLTGSPMPFQYIRAEGKAGRLGQRLMAIVAEGIRGRVYLPPSHDHAALAQSALPTWRPEGEMPKKHRNFQPPVYGMNSYGDLFTDRQLVVLTCFADLIASVHGRVMEDLGYGVEQRRATQEVSDYADAVVTYLALAIDRLANYASTLCTWHSGVKYETLTSTFGRQALPMTWDFAEGNPFSGSSGNIDSQISGVVSNLLALPVDRWSFGEVMQRDAASLSDMQAVVSTDPPYYDNIAYAELSDYFYVWLRRSLNRFYPQLFSTLLSPKSQELVAAPHRHDGDQDRARDFFEGGLKKAFTAASRIQSPTCPLTIFYAFKQAETEDDEEEAGVLSTASTGWETMLEGLIGAGLSVTGTWPVRTELTGNLKKNIAALASSVVLSCVPRTLSAPLATRREFLNALKRELPDSLRKLQSGSVAPVDLAQAAIGPGMAVFTRYAKVMEGDGSPMKVRQALALINQMLDEVLAEQEGEFDSDTRWALAWFEQFSMEEGAFGVAETLSKAKNTAVNALVEAGIIHARGGKVRLLKRDEMPEDWNPATDNKVRHWEVAQQLIRSLESGGETAASALLRKVGGMGEVARDLAYRLYNICERKKWTSEALSYNGLVIAWPEISRLAQQAPPAAADEQARMF